MIVVRGMVSDDTINLIVLSDNLSWLLSGKFVESMHCPEVIAT